MNLLANLRHLRLSHVLFTVLVAAILLYLIIPVLIVVPMSFSEARFLQFPPKQWSFHWYEAFFNSVEWMSAARVSLITAFSPWPSACRLVWRPPTPSTTPA